MVNLVDLIINALIISSLYSIVSLGFTLIYGVGEVLNLAYGAQITLGAFTAFQVFQTWQNVWIAILIGAVVSSVAGVVLYFGAVRYIQHNPMSVIIVTLGIGFIIEHLLRIFITPQSISFPPILSGNLSVSGYEVGWNLLFVIFSAWVFIGTLFLLVNHTKIGKATIALSNSNKGAKLVGIDTDMINVFSWGIAGLLAGYAGILLLSFQSGQWNMGLQSLVLAFSIVILGGLGSLRGSVIAAYIIGSMETFVITVISTKLLGLTSLVVIIVVLTVYPQGIYGRESVEL